MNPRLLRRQAALCRARAALDLEEAELLEAAAAELAAELPKPRPGARMRPPEGPVDEVAERRAARALRARGLV